MAHPIPVFRPGIACDRYVVVDENGVPSFIPLHTLEFERDKRKLTISDAHKVTIEDVLGNPDAGVWKVDVGAAGAVAGEDDLNVDDFMESVDHEKNSNIVWQLQHDLGHFARLSQR